MSIKLEPGEVVRAVVFGRWADGTGEDRMVFHYHNQNAIAAEINDDDVDEWIGLMTATLAPIIVDNHEFYAVRFVNESQFAVWTWTPESPIKGTNLSQPFPQQVAALVLGYTNTKRCIAKKYIPAIGEDQGDRGVWDPSTLTNLKQFGQWWLMGFSTGGILTLEPVVYRRSDQSVHPLTAFSVAAIAATQRRRKQGVGI